MNTHACILTAKDFTILEVMRDRCLGRDDPLAQILDRKIEHARVIFRDDAPENLATLSSRVSFSVDGRDPDTRIISHDRMNSPVGMSLPITTPRGLALLGLSEGQEFLLSTPEGGEERVVLEKVHYQPEAARREKEAADRLTAHAQRRPALQLVRGGLRDQPALAPAGSGDFDDPGPSAA